MVTADDVTVRPATVADIPDLVRLRRVMFEGMGWGDHEQLATAEAASAAYLAEAIPTGKFRAWVASRPRARRCPAAA